MLRFEVLRVSTSKCEHRPGNPPVGYHRWATETTAGTEGWKRSDRKGARGTFSRTLRRHPQEGFALTTIKRPGRALRPAAQLVDRPREGDGIDGHRLPSDLYVG